MLTEYLNAAMRHARCEILADEGTYYGEITECQGVYAKAPTLEACRSELLSVLEDWILFRVYKNLELPRINGVELPIKRGMDREHAPTPPVLYKYYAFNECTQNIFERNEIYFQSADGFNDPFDSKVSTTYEGTEEERVSRLIDLWRKGLSERQERRKLASTSLGCCEAKSGHLLIMRIIERSPNRDESRWASSV